MADGFLEALGNEEPGQGDGAQVDGADVQSADDTGSDVQQGDQAADTQPEGEAGEQTNHDRQPVDDDVVLKAKEEAAYWRGRYEAANPDTQQQARYEPTDEELRQREDEYLADPYGVTERIIQQQLVSGLQQFNMAQSVDRMRKEAGDYDQVIAKYQEMAKTDPSLEAQLSNQIDPAKFAYDYVKRTEVLSAHGGDPKKLEQEIEKKVRADIEAKVRQELAIREAGDTPPTPATARGSGGTTPANIGSNYDPLNDNSFD